MHHFADLLFNRQRKLFVTGMTALAICGGFVYVTLKPTQQSVDAYKVGAEWLVWLCAAYNGGNALTYFAQRGQPSAAAKAPPPADPGHKP